MHIEENKNVVKQIECIRKLLNGIIEGVNEEILKCKCPMTTTELIVYRDTLTEARDGKKVIHRL